MKVIEIAFTSYPVTDLKRARQFYEGVLGLKRARFFGKENTGFVEDDIWAGDARDRQRRARLEAVGRRWLGRFGGR